MSLPTVSDMRIALSLGPGVSDAAVVDAYVAALGYQPPASPSPSYSGGHAIESDEDLAVFFDPAEFGEAILYDGLSGFSAIWNRPTEDVAIGSAAIIATSNTFEFPASTVPRPAPGRTIRVIRTGEAFTIGGEPRLNRDGTILICEAVPAP